MVVLRPPNASLVRHSPEVEPVRPVQKVPDIVANESFIEPSLVLLAGESSESSWELQGWSRIRKIVRQIVGVNSNIEFMPNLQGWSGTKVLRRSYDMCDAIKNAANRQY